MGKRKRFQPAELPEDGAADPLIGQTFFVDREVEDEEAPRGGFNSQVLPVAELDDDWEGEPGDGSEYLSLVRRQAAGLLDIVSVNAPYPTPPPSAMAASKMPPPKALLQRPSDPWRESFEAGFKRLRIAMRTAGASPTSVDLSYLPMPNDDDESRWRSYLYGVKRDNSRKPSAAHSNADQSIGAAPITPTSDMELEDVEAEAREAEEAKYRPKMPNATLLKLFHQSTAFALLEHFDGWIAERFSRAISGPSTAFLPPAVRRRGPAAAAPRAASAAPAAPKKPVLDAFDTQWLFALLAIVDDLLAGDDIDRLRRLAKTCLAVLAAEPKVTLDEDAKAGCWMVVAAVAGTWGQRDLWMEV